MKKLIIGILILALLVLPLIGCGHSSGETEREERLRDALRELDAEELLEVSPVTNPEAWEEFKQGVERKTSKEQGPIPFENNLYTIRVLSNPLTETETEFSGSYMEVTTDSHSTSRSVDGTTPVEYQVYGMIISCCFQNQNDYGMLSVEILYKGKVIKSSYTTADYGVVTVATN